MVAARQEMKGEGTLASPGMPADHERCRYDGFTFYSLPTGCFTPTAPPTVRALYISPSPLPLRRRFHWLKNKSPPRASNTIRCAQSD